MSTIPSSLMPRPNRDPVNVRPESRRKESPLKPWITEQHVDSAALLLLFISGVDLGLMAWSLWEHTPWPVMVGAILWLLSAALYISLRDDAIKAQSKQKGVPFL